MNHITHHIEANRPPFRRKLPCLLFVTLAFITQVDITSTLESKQTWPSVSLNGFIDNLVADQVEGSVFVTVDGDIYKYTNSLNFLASTSQQVNNSKDTTRNEFVNKVLTKIILSQLNQSGKNPDVLFSCWQNKNLTLRCMFYRMNDLRSVPTVWSSVSTKSINFKTDFNEHIQVIPDKHDNNYLLIVTNRPATSVYSSHPTNDFLLNQLANVINSTTITPSRQDSPHLPALARFKISKSTKFVTLDLTSVLAYSARIEDFIALYEYVYMFQHQDYTHFVLNDIRKSATGKEVTNTARFARICNNDTELESYTEISLTCKEQIDLYAKSAYLDTNRSDGPTLFVIFESTKDGSSIRQSTKSYLCAYSMGLIQDVFQKAISDCHSGHPSSFMLAKLHPESDRPPICQRNPSNDWCTSKTNPYIDGYSYRYNVKENNYIELDGFSAINFIHTLQQGPGDDIYFIGTETGLITKMNQKQDLYYTVDLFNHKMTHYLLLDGRKYSDIFQNLTEHYSPSSQSFVSRHGAKYALGPGVILATINEELHQLPTNSCNIYDSCRSCENRDAACVWCGDSCSKKDDCGSLEQHITSCPPYIKSFEPPFGPLNTTIKLVIYGDNFGSSKGNITIKVADQDCEVEKDTISIEKLQCFIQPVAHVMNATVHVSVNDETSYLYFKGSARSSVPFYFRDDIRPEASPSADTTTIAETGEGGMNYINNYVISIVLVSLIVLALVYLTLSESFTRLKLKLPKSLKSKSDDLGGAQVSYRKPAPGDSLNGLIKLNNSILSSDYFGKSDHIEQDKPLMNNMLDDEIMSILRQEKILIDRNRLTLGHVLGSGQFGRVYKGFLKIDTGEHLAVAVKTLHSRCHWDDATDNRAFLDEGLMMKDFKHENVLALIGVTFDANGLPMVITPFMHYGDLRSYISDEASSPTVKELIEFGTQVARGMAYLSNLKFVHRDLAARNCMLDENLTVKVADFGLSRDIYERDYYSSDNKKAKLPVKWMALESLEKSVYSTKSDVWSYGVLLWELMTRGVVPYPDVDNFDLFSYLKEGRRMLRPRYCPVILYNIMLSCWHENPAMRPTFVDLVESVSDVITKLRGNDDEQKVSRDMTYSDALH